MAVSKALRRMLLSIVLNYWILKVFILVNVFLFWLTYEEYKQSLPHYYLRQILGSGLCVSRASATVINLNLCLLLLPMCKQLNGCFLNCLKGISFGSMILVWLSNLTSLHILFGWISFIAGFVHSVAHIINAYHFSVFFDEEHLDINWASYKNENTFNIVLKSLPGVTGILMLIIMLVLGMTALSCVRSRRYNCFWFCHHLGYVFLILFIVHPLAGVLKKQTNLDAHTPGCTYNISSVTVTVCKEQPVFESMQANSWLWVLIPLVIFLTELVLRIFQRNCNSTIITETTKFDDAVLLCMPVPHPKFQCKPGQFVKLQNPQISAMEWHPFTVFRIPSTTDPSLKVLIGDRGDWTGKFNSYCENYNNKEPIRCLIDGPFHSVMEQILERKCVICVAGGVGITSFTASFDKLINNDLKLPLRLHLFWVVRHASQLEYCDYLLSQLHNKFWYNNQPDRFTFRIFLTNSKKQRIYLLFAPRNLVSRITQERPKLIELLESVKNYDNINKYHVFASGPKAILHDTKRACQEINFKLRRTKFVYACDR